jgi:hypothetical protein
MCRLAADNTARLAESERAVQLREAELREADAAYAEARAAAAGVRREQQALEQQGMALSSEQVRTESYYILGTWYRGT